MKVDSLDFHEQVYVIVYNRREIVILYFLSQSTFFNNALRVIDQRKIVSQLVTIIRFKNYRCLDSFFRSGNAKFPIPLKSGNTQTKRVALVSEEFAVFAVYTYEYQYTNYPKRVLLGVAFTV